MFAVTVERSLFMPTHERQPAPTPLAGWLRSARKRAGLTVRALAINAGISHPRISQIEAGDSASRDMIERLARGLTPPDADEHTAEHLLIAGLKAAGFALVQEITYELDPDALALAEGYNGLPDMARRIVDSAYKSASELALAMDREGVKGKRVED